MIDEASKRRAEWVEGNAFKLADGQLWHFQEPRIEAYPTFDNGKVHLGLSTHLGPEFDAVVNEIAEAETLTDEIKLAFGMAAFMLRANYDLSDAELSTLLRYRVGDEASKTLYSGIVDIALGNPPKDFPDGSR